MVEGFEVHGVPYHENRRENTDTQKFNQHYKPTDYHPERSDYYDDYDYDEDRFESKPSDRSKSKYKSAEEIESVPNRRKGSEIRREDTRSEEEREYSRQHHRLNQDDSYPSRSGLKSSQNFRYA